MGRHVFCVKKTVVFEQTLLSIQYVFTLFKSSSLFTRGIFLAFLQENLQSYKCCMAVVNEGGAHWVLLVCITINRESLFTKQTKK